MRSFLLVITIFFCVCSPVQSEGLTPTSPEVQASVNRAITYLNAHGKSETRVGGKALIGLALTKSGADNNHPLIIDAVDAIRKRLAEDTIKFSYPIYDIGISAMFLAELDPSEYSPELRKLADLIAFTQQRPAGTEGGGWGYLTSNRPNHYGGGDMSMTQYAIMGSWTIYRNGGQISEKMIQSSAKWLLYVQTEDGSYAYTSTITPEGRITRDSVRASTTAAGMATVYVMRDLLGLNPKTSSGQERVFTPPDAFRLVENEDNGLVGGKKTIKTTIPRSAFTLVQERGDNRVDQNLRPIAWNMNYLYYYLYALERYYSFKEIADNRFEASPEWYNLIADFLLEKQKADGSWRGLGCGDTVDTSYGVLVLLRSTKQSIGKGPPRLEGGNMQGGRGLPKTTDQLVVKDGQIISLTEMGSADSLMERLDKLGELDDQTLSRLSQASNYELGIALSRNSAQIRKLIGSGTPEMRRATVEMLGKNGDVRQTPALIYALTDPDPDVAAAAQTALLSLSRNPNGKKLPDSKAKDYEKVRGECVEFWKNWYKKIDSSAVFD